MSQAKFLLQKLFDITFNRKIKKYIVWEIHWTEQNILLMLKMIAFVHQTHAMSSIVHMDYTVFIAIGHH